MTTNHARMFALLISFLTFVIGLWLGWEANSFIAQDACLDRGGAWFHETRTCMTGNQARLGK
jgi:hypothetical protein